MALSKDEKLKRTVDAIHEVVRELRTAANDKPELTLGSVEAKAWLLALDLHMEHLDIQLHDIQPALF